MNRSETLVHGGLVVTMRPDRAIIDDGAVAIRDGVIRAVGKSAELMARHPDATRIDARGGLVTPGFVDAHNHSAHFLTKGLLDDVETSRRWRERLYPFEAQVSEDETYWGALGTYAEMLLHGTTCTADPGCRHPAAVVRAVERIGIRGSIAAIVSDTNDPMRPLVEGARIDPKAAAADNERLFQSHHGSAGGRVQVAFGLWSGTTVSDELCLHVRDLAERHGAMMHGHLASKPWDNEVSLKHWGVRAVERYRRLGVLGPRFAGAHMGAIDDAEVDIVAASGAHVIHAPSASMLGAFGCIAHGKFPELAAAGANLALGSDAAAISRFLDMPRIMQLAACAHKDVRRDAEVMGAHRAMEMATRGGAAALGLGDAIGSIEVGKRADLVLIRTDGIEWHPRPAYNPVANLVYSSGGYRVDTVLVDGRIVVQGGRLTTIDEAELRERTRLCAASAAHRAGIEERAVWPIV